ncbi:MAG: site-2 protease family protein [Candidatus Omnitrophota bacterium]
MTNIFSIVTFILILLVSVAFHEYAHGWMAAKLGDPTPKNSGRLTLNPLAHIDLFGTIIMPILLIVVSRGTFTFGYAKPVPINPSHFKNPKKDLRLVGAAGPGANILIALFLSLVLKLDILVLKEALFWGIMINLILAVFNLIPIPPLDGSKILASLLPNRLAYNYLRLESYGFLIIMFLIMTGLFRKIIMPFINLILYFLLKIAGAA